MVTAHHLEVRHVVDLSYHLIPLRLIADAGNCYIDTLEGITITFSESGDELFSKSIGRLMVFIVTGLISQTSTCMR